MVCTYLKVGVAHDKHSLVGLDEDIGSVVIRTLNSRKESSLVIQEDIDQTVIRLGDLVNETKQVRWTIVF